MRPHGGPDIHLKPETREDPGHDEPRRDHRGCRWMTCVVCRRERLWSTCAGHQTCNTCRGLQYRENERLQHLADATADDLKETRLWTT